MTSGTPASGGSTVTKVDPSAPEYVHHGEGHHSHKHEHGEHGHHHHRHHHEGGEQQHTHAADHPLHATNAEHAKHHMGG